MAKVHLELDMPDDELQPFIKAYRGWDDGHAKIESKIWVTNTELTIEEIQLIVLGFVPAGGEKASLVKDQLRKYWE